MLLAFCPHVWEDTESQISLPQEKDPPPNNNCKIGFFSVKVLLSNISSSITAFLMQVRHSVYTCIYIFVNHTCPKGKDI